MILDDYELVTPQSEQQVRNAYAAAAWRLQYARRASCPDIRDDELRARGDFHAMRIENVRAWAKAAHEQLLRRRRAARHVIPFPRTRISR